MVKVRCRETVHNSVKYKTVMVRSLNTCHQRRRKDNWLTFVPGVCASPSGLFIFKPARSMLDLSCRREEGRTDDK